MGAGRRIHFCKITINLDQAVDHEGNSYYYNHVSGMSQWERPEVFDLKRRTLRTAQLAVSAASNLTHFVGQSLDPGIEPTAIPAAVEQERLSKVNAMVDKMLEELADGDSEHDPDTAQGGGEELQAPAILTVDDWQTFWVDVDGDKGWGGYYFVNSQSGQTTWDCPDPRLLQFTDALNRTRVAALMCFNPYHVTIPHPVAVQGRWAVFADPDTATPYFVRLSEGQALAWKKVILGDIPPSEVLAAVPTVQTEQCPSAAESPSGGGDFPAGHSQWDQPADWDSDAAACPPLTLLGDWLVYREPAVLMQYFVHRQTQESAWVPPPAVASSVVGAAGATVYSAPCVAQVGQWQLMCDDTTGGWYYYNEADGCSQWEPPAEVVEADMDAWQIVDPNAAARFFEGGGEADGSHQNEEGGNEETGNAVEGEGVGSDGPAPPGLITEPMHAPFAAPQATPTPAATKTPEAAGSASSTQRIVVHRPRASCAGLLPALPKRRSRLSMAAGPDATAAATAANAAGQANGVSSTTTTPRGVEGIGPLAPTLRSIMPLRPATPTSPVSQSTAGGSEGGLSIDGLNTPRSDGGSGPVAVARPANSPVSPAWAEHADPERMFDSRRDLMGSFGAAALKPTSNVTNTAGSSAALHSGRGNPASGRSTGTGTGPTGSGSSTPQRQSPRGMAAKPDHDGALSDSEDVQTGRDKSGGTGHSADAKEPFRLPWGLGGGVAVYSAQSKRPAAPSKPATMTIRPSEAAAPNGEAGGTAAAPVANAQAGAAGFDDFIRKRLTAVHEKQLAEAMARRNKAGGGRPAAALKQVATSELLEDMGGQGTDYMVEVPGENVEEALLDAVAGLAGACGLAPPDLLRVLQKGGGVDPVKWAATYRLKLAQQLNDMEQQTGGIPAAKEREMRRKRDIATRMLSWESEERAKRRSQREVLKRQQLKQQEAEMEALRMRRNKVKHVRTMKGRKAVRGGRSGERKRWSGSNVSM